MVNADLKHYYALAKEIAQVHADTIKRIADALLKYREMDGTALSELLELRDDIVANPVFTCTE